MSYIFHSVMRYVFPHTIMNAPFHYDMSYITQSVMSHVFLHTLINAPCHESYHTYAGVISLRLR